MAFFLTIGQLRLRGTGPVGCYLRDAGGREMALVSTHDYCGCFDLFAVPTGIKVFSWVATMWRRPVEFRTPLLWAIGFIAAESLGHLRRYLELLFNSG